MIQKGMIPDAETQPDAKPADPAALVRQQQVVNGTDGNDTLNGSSDVDLMFGNGGNDLLLGLSANDILLGGAGNDTLDGGDGNDGLFGGDGSDTLLISAGSDTLAGYLLEDAASDSSIDTLDASAVSLDILDTSGITVTYTGVGEGSVDYDGTSRFFGIEAVVGTLLGDVMTGAAGNEIFSGGLGNDTLSGGAGNDLLQGEGENDTLLLGSGADTLVGGTGSDTLSGASLGSGMSLVFDGVGSGRVTVESDVSEFSGIEAVQGSDLADTLTGGSGSDNLSGGLGNDVIIGGAGSDTTTVSASLLDTTIYSTDSGFRIVSDDGDDSFAGIETYIFSDVTLSSTELAQLASPEPEDTITDGGTDTVDGGDPGETLTGVRSPVGDAISSRSDPAIGEVLFAGGGVTLSSIDYVGAPEAIGLLPDGHVITDGTISVGIENGVFLSSGGGPGSENTSGSFTVNHGTAGNALLDAAVAGAFDDAGGTNDAAVLTFTFDSSELDGLTTLSFNVFFGSDEFPEFADSSFVDIAAVYVNGVNYALFNNDPGQPLAIVGESINTAGNFFSNGGDTFDTEYDGFSTLLTVLAPVQDGTNTVVIGIADTGDSAYDSGIFVGNLAGSEIQATGSFVNVFGTDEDDILYLNIAPQIVDLAGGRDTITGDLDEVDNDVIYGWGDNDLLIYRESFDVSAFSVVANATTAVLTVDTNGDGVAEAVTTLYGNFSVAEFVVTQVGNTVEVVTVGTLPDPPVVLTGGADDETLRGGSGGDLIQGGGGDDVIDGGEGDDRLGGGAGNDDIEGDFGEDQLGGGPGNDLVDGGDGNDALGGGTGDDLIYGGAGTDTIGGGDGDDSVLAGSGNDIVNGGAGNDLLDGMSGDDTVGGSFGHDEVYGGSGDDSLGGGAGRDTIHAGEGNDIVGGGEGDDVIYGVAGSNFLAGGGRNDLIVGGHDADTINGGTGNDTLAGGAGEDLFIFNGLRVGEVDTIDDFTIGEDLIRLVGVQSFSALSFENTEIYEGAGVTMTIAGHTIMIAGVTMAQLDADDFLFG
ncbi:putative calcium-binding protein [Puniceibacterium sp. IMCC21224]|nr:putative calcium-binding protein [Puniceibacterium sp. IMCC21224]